MSFWVYAIELKGILVYIGMSKEPMLRLRAHRRRFRNRDLDIRLITGFDNRDDAYVFEQRCIGAVLRNCTVNSVRNVLGHF